MENGGSSNPRRNYRARAPTTVIDEATHAEQLIHPQASFKRDADQYMPIANVIRIMRRTLPAHAKISDDAKETIQECVSEFISFVTSEANERCHKEYRKTITPDDVLTAMASLGFENYVDPLTAYLERHRALQDPERAAAGANGTHHHAAPYARRGVIRPIAQMAQPAPPPPPSPPQPQMQQQAMSTRGYLQTTMPTSPFAVDRRRNYVGEYFMGGGGEGSSSGAGYTNPFAQQFK